MAFDVTEILSEVRRLQIVAARQVDDLLSGAYRSVFKGRGMEFEEVREYAPGDDVRTIDWNVTARTGRPHIKRHAEERELTLIFLVDISGSGVFGSQRSSKLERATEVASLLMLSAQKNNDKIGLALFSNAIESYYPPRKGRASTWRLVRELVAVDRDPEELRARAQKAKLAGESPRTDLAGALRFINKVQRRRAIIFVLSDFIDPTDYEQALKVAGKRHDVVAVPIVDPRERSLPSVGFVRLEDPETGEVLELDTHHARVRDLFAAQQKVREEQFSDLLKRSGIDEMPVRTDRPYTASLHGFFRRRERRRGGRR